MARRRRTDEERRQAAADYASSRSSSGSAGYNPATSAGRSTISPGWSNTPGINQNVHSWYWGGPGPGQSTQEYLGLANEVGYNWERLGTGGGTGATPRYGGGGGGGGRGGGGGGGGAPAMTQAMFDAMMKALGARGGNLNLTMADLPDFQGMPLGAFNPQLYNQASTDLSKAVAADQAAITANQGQTTQALNSVYSNPYAAAQPAQAAVPAQAQNLAGSVGASGGNYAQSVSDVNAGGADQAAAFGNLMNVLAANNAQSQQSRLGQVALDAATAQRQVGAQNLALGSQINMARNQAQMEWQRQAAERDYQNSLMRQQWNREELTRNQDVTNQMNTANWQAGNERIAQVLQPLLDIIARTAGTKINLGGIQALLQGLGAQ